MKRTPEEEKAFEEWKIKRNKEAYRVSQLTDEERKKHYATLPEKTEREEQLERKFKTMEVEEENSTTAYIKGISLIVSIIMGLLFFNGTVPFLFFIFPLLTFCYLAF